MFSFHNDFFLLLFSAEIPALGCGFSGSRTRTLRTSTRKNNTSSCKITKNKRYSQIYEQLFLFFFKKDVLLSKINDKMSRLRLNEPLRLMMVLA